MRMRTRFYLSRRAGTLGLCLLVWCMFSASVASAIVSGVDVALSTAQVGAASSYSITFTATRGLAGGDQIMVFAHSAPCSRAPPHTCPDCAPDLSDYQGTAAVTVMLPGPGVVTVSGARVSSSECEWIGRALVLDISPTRALKRRLRLRGRMRIRLRVRYAPIGGAASTFTRTVTLRRL